MQNNHNPDNKPNGAAVLILLVGLIFVIWFVFHDSTARSMLNVGLLFLKPLKATVGFFQPEVFNAIDENVRLSMQNAYIKKVNFGVLKGLFSWMGTYYRWPLLILMSILAYRAWRHPIIHLHTIRTMESLIQYQSLVWKPIVPILKLDLCEDTSEAWLPSRQSIDIAKMNRLIHGRRLKLDETWVYLEKQLGERFSLNRLKDHERALFAIFAARIARDRKGAAKLLDDLNESCRKSGLPDFSVANQLFVQYKDNKIVKAKIRGFGYTRSVLFQMLVEARRFDGKLPTSNFIWLRPVDRTLWYSLQRAPVDVDRYQLAAFSEGIAAASQWQAEILARKNKMRMGVSRKDPETGEAYRVNVPYLITAITSLAINLEECGEIDFPPMIENRTQSMLNERKKFNAVRNDYIMAGLAGFFEQRGERARAAAVTKKIQN